jgi:hypothetical protein
MQLLLGRVETHPFSFLVYIAPKVCWGVCVRSHIGSECPEPGPYKCMLTLTSKTRFGVMHGCQEQTRKGDLGGSPGFGWTGRPKANNILLVRWGVTVWHQDCPYIPFRLTWASLYSYSPIG